MDFMSDDQIKMMLILKHGSVLQAQYIWSMGHNSDLIKIGWTQEELDYLEDYSFGII